MNSGKEPNFARCAISPKLSIVVVSDCDSQNLRMALACLRAQTVSNMLEVIIVTSSKERLNLDPRELEGFFNGRVLELRSHGNEGQAKAAGIVAAGAPLVAFMEDHSYPEPGYAKALIEAHCNGDFAAVGPVMLNANPHSTVSWGCFLVFYGPWMAAQPEAEVEHLPGNQSCYKRNVLVEYGPRLAEMLESESLLHWDLIAKGYKLHLEPTSKVYHLNFSLLSPLLFEHFLASRVFAANRARGWGAPRRLHYALGSPLLPMIRLVRILKDAARAELGARVVVRAFVALTLNLCAGSAGEMLGYAFGPGEARERLVRFEEKRHLYVTTRDLEAVAKLRICAQ